MSRRVTGTHSSHLNERRVSQSKTHDWGKGPEGDRATGTDGTNEKGGARGSVLIRVDARLFPPLVVHEKVGANAPELGIGLVPHLGFEDLSFIHEWSVIA